MHTVPIFVKITLEALPHYLNLLLFFSNIPKNFGDKGKGNVTDSLLLESKKYLLIFPFPFDMS